MTVTASFWLKTAQPSDCLSPAKTAPTFRAGPGPGERLDRRALERITARYEQDRSKGRSFDPILLLTDIPFEQVAAIEAELFRWPGLQVVTHSKRHYTQGEALRPYSGVCGRSQRKRTGRRP